MAHLLLILVSPVPAAVDVNIESLDSNNFPFIFSVRRAEGDESAGVIVSQIPEPESEVPYGSVIQLTLGDYGPIRFHLRLFRTREGGNGSGTVTAGGWSASPTTTCAS